MSSSDRFPLKPRDEMNNKKKLRKWKIKHPGSMGSPSPSPNLPNASRTGGGRDGHCKAAAAPRARSFCWSILENCGAVCFVFAIIIIICFGGGGSGLVALSCRCLFIFFWSRGGGEVRADIFSDRNKRNAGETNSTCLPLRWVHVLGRFQRRNFPS